jgi:MFS transporter, DHA1 family, multidrug resistance protein
LANELGQRTRRANAAKVDQVNPPEAAVVNNLSGGSSDSHSVASIAAEPSMKFRVFAAMAMAASALSIDSILPAFAKIRTELGLAADSSATAGLITAFFLGYAVAQIPMGISTDRFGRRPLLFVSSGIYLLGVVGMAVSTSLFTMMASRFVWGIGAAGLRVAAMAMVRDRFVGARMAREMAFVMAVFITVPIFAPALGAAILHFFPWRVVLLLSAAFGVGIAGLTTFMPETLETKDRQPFRLSQISLATRAILKSRHARNYTLVLTAIFGVFSSYLASSERIIGDVFLRKSQFPYLFGAVGVVMGITSILVGRNVERIGLIRVIRSAISAYLALTVVLLAFVLINDGIPPFWPFWILLTGVLALHNVVFPNVNSAAMIPLGHVAGTASAVVGTLSTAVGAAMGAFIDNVYDGTVRPLMIAFALSACVAAALALPIRTLEH